MAHTSWPICRQFPLHCADLINIATPSPSSPSPFAVLRSLHQFCIILNSVIVQKENFPTQQTWCLNIFPFTFLFRLSDKRNVVGSNWKCPFENFHFESLKRSRRRGLLMLSDTASLWTRCRSTSGRSAIWTTAHNDHSPPRHCCTIVSLYVQYGLQQAIQAPLST